MRIHYEDPYIQPHGGRPWLLAHIKERHGKDLAVARKAVGNVVIEHDLTAAHALLVGNSGSGKTRLALHLFREQLRRGCSGVFMDFKAATIQQAVQCAVDAGMDKEQITLVWPSEDGAGIPGWNPFAVPLSQAEQAVGQFTNTLKHCVDSWGSRMDHLLKNAGVVMLGQHLSLWELVKFIQPGNDSYRTGLLRQASGTEAWSEYPLRHDYFLEEFKTVAKTESVGAVLNKLTTLVSNRYLKAMLCSRTDQLQLDTLWQKPRAILIHLNQETLTYDGARILAGMIAQYLFSVAMRKPGDRPVVLVMDELESQERYLGDSLKDILAKSRQQGLQMIGACQNIDQMSPDLRKLFMGAALRSFFNLEWSDAKYVAQSLTAGTKGRDTRIAITADKLATVSVSAPIVDRHGNQLDVTDRSWELFRGMGKGTIEALEIVGRAGGIDALYVISPSDRKIVGLAAYLKGVAKDRYHFSGPVPISVTVTFPRPNVQVEERKTESERTSELAKKLSDLPNREAIVKVRGAGMAHIRVTDVSFPALPDPLSFLGNGQSAQDIRETAAWRAACIERLSGIRGIVREAEYQEVSEGGNL